MTHEMKAYQRLFIPNAGRLHPRRRGVKADGEIGYEIYHIVLGGPGGCRGQSSYSVENGPMPMACAELDWQRQHVMSI